MKLTKNIMILFGSYLGAVALVSCIGQLSHPFSGAFAPADPEGAGNGDCTVGAVDTEEEDIPAAIVTEDSVADSSKEEPIDTKEPSGSGDAAGDGARPEGPRETYSVRTVRDESGAATHAIGVYDGEGKLLDLLDTPVFALPEKDREMLKSGIEVEGKEALAALLEDLGA